MADPMDMATDIVAEHLARGIASINAAIPAGEPGECDGCFECMPRIQLDSFFHPKPPLIASSARRRGWSEDQAAWKAQIGNAERICEGWNAQHTHTHTPHSRGAGGIKMVEVAFRAATLTTEQYQARITELELRERVLAEVVEELIAWDKATLGDFCPAKLSKRARNALVTVTGGGE